MQLLLIITHYVAIFELSLFLQVTLVNLLVYNLDLDEDISLFCIWCPIWSG